MKEDYRKSFLQVLVVISLVIANLVALKLGEIYGLVVCSSVVIYPFTFLGIALLQDLYGKKTALKTGLMAIIFQLLVLIPYALVVNMPVQNLIYDFSGEVETVFTFDSSIVVSSLIAFTVGQLVNIYLFEFMKKYSYKIIGAALSILFGLVIDSIIFILLSGWGMPEYALISRIYSQITTSVFMTFILTVIFILVSYYPYVKVRSMVSKRKEKKKDVKKSVK